MKKKLTPRRVADNSFTYLALIVLSAIFLFPCLWLILASLSKTGSLYDFKGFFPEEYSFQTFIDLFTDDVNGLYPYKTWFFNTLYVATCSALFGTILVLLTGYVMSRFRFKGRENLFLLFTIGILVPLNALMVPYFVIINELGLYNTYGGMILLYCAIGIPMSTVIIRGLMDSIPMEIEEAAYIDGCGFYGRFFRIILPLSRTGIVTAATFQFLTCWNEFVFANLIVSSDKLRTIQVGIRYFTNQFSTDYVSMYAAIVISIVPSILAYVLFQEQIINGLTSGAVKG